MLFTLILLFTCIMKGKFSIVFFTSHTVCNYSNLLQPSKPVLYLGNLMKGRRRFCWLD